MASIATLKKSSADMTRLVKEIEKINSGGERESDTRFWQPTVDKAGNGSAVIRFLPAPAVDGEDALPWVRVFRHAFQGPSGKWYMENSLTTLPGQKDPVGEYNSVLWKEGTDDDSPERKQARDQKRKLEYFVNILVVKDPGNTENEGKVFLYKFGKKIFDKIESAMKSDDDDPGFNPFDAWEGANFKLDIKTVAKFRNYDDSKFLKQSPIGTDEEIERIWNSEYSLKEFIDPSKFKTYDELKRKMEDVLELNKPGMRRAAPAQRKPVEDSGDAIVDDDTSPLGEDDDDLKLFKSLVDDD